MKKIIEIMIIAVMFLTCLTGCVNNEKVRETVDAPAKTEEKEVTPKETAKPTVKPKATAAPKQSEAPAQSAEPKEEIKATAKAKATEKAKKTAEPKETTHVHNWIPITETQRVCVSEAYDEPIYEERPYWHCSCGHNSYSTSENNAHMEEHALKGEYQYTWGIAYETIQTGTKHHDAVYENREVTVGYMCECGATK